MRRRSDPPLIAVGDGSLPVADYLRHNYAKKLRTLQLAGTFRAGESRHVDIRHDGWCALLRQPPGYCNCDPEITLRPTVGTGDS